MTPFSTFRNQMGRKIQRAVIPLVVWLGVWQFVAFCVGKELLLPGPAAVWETLKLLGATSTFWITTLHSLGRILTGFAAGVLLGTGLAVLTRMSTLADWVISPAVRVIRAVPVASFILLVLLWSPSGQVPAITAALMVLPVVWGNVAKGIAQTDPLLLEVARAYRFGRGKVVRLVYVPSVLPYFSSGCHTALGLAWKSGVAAEVLCVPKQAIGTQVYFSKIYLETRELFAWTVVVVVLSLLLEHAMGAVFRRMGRGWTNA